MLRTALLKLGAFGVEPSVPVSVAGEDPADKAALAQQGQALLKLSGPRLDQGAALRTAAGGRRSARPPCAAGRADARGVRATVRRAAALHVRCGRARPSSRARSAASTAAQGGDPLAVTYLVRAVRAGARRRGAHGRLPAARRSARRRRAAESERRAAAVRERRALGRPAAGCRRRHAAEQAVARGAHHRHDQHHAVHDRAAGGRMGRGRARTPARPPRWRFSSTCRTRARRRACSSPCRRCRDRTGPPRRCAAC